MITFVDQLELFKVDVVSFSLSLPHNQISEYLLESSKTWNHYTTYHDQDLNKKVFENLPGIDKFVDTIKDCAKQYVSKTDRRQFKNNDDMSFLAWASVYDQYDSHGSHIHNQSLIAGTYYPQANKDSSPLVLTAPWISRTMHDTIDRKRTEFRYKPVRGECLMWPAWLNHHVPMQKNSDAKRIAISFNVDYIRYHS